jgi:hypothetical protein
MRINGQVLSVIGGEITAPQDAVSIEGSDVNSKAGITVNSQDSCVNLWLKNTPNNGRNHMMMDLKMLNPANRGSCADQNAVQPIEEDILFTTQELYKLCNLCGFPDCNAQHPISPPAKQVSAQTGKKACSEMRISYETAAEQCLILSQHTVQGDEPFLQDACIFDYCLSNGDESFVEDALAVEQHLESEDGLGAWIDLSGKSVSQSSTVKLQGAEKAIGGEKVQVWNSDCARTNKAINPFWKVNLGRNLNIKNVKIAGSDSPTFNRLFSKGLVVKVGGETCATDIEVIVNGFTTVPCNLTGSEIEILRPNPHPLFGNILMVCEVEVFADSRYR